MMVWAETPVSAAAAATEDENFMLKIWLGDWRKWIGTRNETNKKEGRARNIRMRRAKPTAKLSLSRHTEARVPSWYLLGTLRVLKSGVRTGAGVSSYHVLLEVLHPPMQDLAMGLWRNG
jgi:hypothetical protein